jgi:hypothetical protein
MGNLLLDTLALRHVECHGNGGVLAIECEAPCFHGYVHNASIRRYVAVRPLCGPMPIAFSDLLKEICALLWNPQFVNRHRQELVAAVPVISARSRICREKLQAFQANDPHGQGVFLE